MSGKMRGRRAGKGKGDQEGKRWREKGQLWAEEV